MNRNPILDELYAACEEVLSEYGGDLASDIRSADERRLASQHPIADIR